MTAGPPGGTLDDGPDVQPLVELVRTLGEELSRHGATASAVAATVTGVIDDQGAPLGLEVRDVEVAGVDRVRLTRRWGTEEPDTAELRLGAPVTLSRLSRQLGETRPVPASGHGGRQRVVFEAGAGDARAWTVFGEMGDADRVTVLTVRRDT